MPEIFRFFGYSFFFYSREHEPIHVHVEGNGGFAKFDYIDDKFVLKENRNIKVSDIKKISLIIEENTDIIVNYWNKFFGN